MSHRRDNVYFERLVEHLEEREWADIQIVNMTHLIGRSALLSCEGVLRVLELQQEVDEEIAAQKECDRWAIGREFGMDAEGEALLPRVIPQDFFEQRFNEVD
jgi:hypothetical protein